MKKLKLLLKSVSLNIIMPITETKINLSDLNRMKAIKNSSAFNESKYEKLINLHEINKSNEVIALANLRLLNTI